MIPTTLRAVALAVSTAIRGVTPTYELFQEPWTAIGRVSHVPGGRLRLFCCEWDPPVPVEDGIYGDDSQEHTAILRVFTNYTGLPETDDDEQDVHAEIASSDGNQLRVVFDGLVDPVNDGVIAFATLGWVWEDAEPGHAWGSHQFELRFLLAH